MVRSLSRDSSSVNAVTPFVVACTEFPDRTRSTRPGTLSMLQFGPESPAVPGARPRARRRISLPCPRPLPSYRFFELSRIRVALPHRDLAVLESKYVHEFRVNRGARGFERSAIPPARDHDFAGPQNLFGRRRKPVPVSVHPGENVVPDRVRTDVRAPGRVDEVLRGVHLHSRIEQIHGRADILDRV